MRAKGEKASRARKRPSPLRAPAKAGDVVEPELVETLEWCLDTPPPLHQFEESPIVVEIAGIEPATGR